MNKEIYGIIYKITNKINGKVYIGQTTNKYGFNGRYSYEGRGIERVYYSNKKRKENGDNYNAHILRAIEKYGFEAFDVVEEYYIAYSREELSSKEIEFIEKYDSFYNGYNQTLGGEGTTGFKKRKIEVKITNPILDLPVELITDKNITANEFKIYTYLMFVNREYDCCKVSMEHISKEINISITTIKRSIKNLEKLGYLKVKKDEDVNIYIDFKYSKKK